jgi:iron complex outermembrane receptor protein
MPARLLTLLFCLLPGCLLASNDPLSEHLGEDLTQLSLADLVNLEVSVVSRHTGSKAQAPAAVHALTADDLARAGVTSLADSLTLVPGLTVGRADSSGWAMGIRGFTGRLARAQLVLIDGRSVYNQLFAGTYWEVQDTVLDDVERVEVVRGPGGTLWGANAVNGIVSVVTKPASQTRGGLVSLGAGSEELFGNLRYGGGLGAKGTYRAYAKSFARDATWHPDGSEYDDWHMTQGGFRTDFDLASDRRLTVQADLYGGRAGHRTRITTYSAPYLRDVDQDARLSGGNVLARWERGPMRLQGYFDRSDRQEAKFGEVRDTWDLDLQHHAGRLGRHDLVWGLSYRRTAGDSHGIETVSVVPPYRADDLYAAFLQDEVSLVEDKLQLIVGAKAEHNSYSGFEVQPSVRALWAPAPHHSVWAAFTRAVRTPSRVEHDIDITIATSASNPVFFRLLGSPDFESETLHAYEVGYRSELGSRVSIDIAGFHNRYGKLLGVESGSPSVEPGRVVLSLFTANSLEGTSSGFETSMIIRPTSRWLVQGDYSYLSLNLAPRPGSRSLITGTDDEGSSPRHQLHARLAVSLSAKLELSGGFRWIDDLPAQEVKAYSELDARVAWRPSRSVELAAVGRNLLHPHHAEFAGDAPTPSQIERAVLATLRLRW